MLSKNKINLVSQVLPYYQCTFENSTISPLGNGLINDTFLVKSSERCFVLQRINLHVFPEPELIAHNLELIHKHLSEKIAQHHYPYTSIGAISNVQGELLTIIDDHCWRALDYITETTTVDNIETTEQAQLVASAFATFSANLHDFDATQLKETIPNFHNINNRLTQLKLAIKNTSPLRKNAANQLIEFVESNQLFIERVNNISEQLPTRVTHNDTKINNLLLDKHSNQPKAIIDLDTCMPGYLMNDFGDLVRTTCANIDENATNIHDMEIDVDIFSVLAKSYIQAFTPYGISNREKDSLVIGTLLIPFMLAIRFLTDHLNGNVYFHCNYETQNLDRAANQFHLFSLLQEKNDELLAVVHQ